MDMSITSENHKNRHEIGSGYQNSSAQLGYVSPLTSWAIGSPQPISNSQSPGHAPPPLTITSVVNQFNLQAPPTYTNSDGSRCTLASSLRTNGRTHPAHPPSATVTSSQASSRSTVQTRPTLPRSVQNSVAPPSSTVASSQGSSRSTKQTPPAPPPSATDGRPGPVRARSAQQASSSASAFRGKTKMSISPSN